MYMEMHGSKIKLFLSENKNLLVCKKMVFSK